MLGCADPPAAPGSTGSGDTTTASSTSGDTTAAASSSEGGPGGPESDAGDGSGEASQGPSDTTGAASTTGSTGAMSLCGDGIVDPDEQCDMGFDGNRQDGACLSDCVLATCGDGFVQANKEECDDQNAEPTDGCHQCGRTRIVFVTSEAYQGDIFMGLWGADQRCRSLAAQAGLANFAGFKAWLSDSKTSARERMYRGLGRYELVNGLLVAESWDALLAGELKNPIEVTEKSTTHSNGAWTGTNPDGTAAEGSNHCLDWSRSLQEDSGYAGATTEISPAWTLIPGDLNPVFCGSELALYCFEQE